MNRSPGIRLEHVRLEHGGHVVFTDLSLTAPGGEWLAVLGRSGVGKSSLLRLIATLDTPVAGTVLADDHQPLGPRVAYMAQDDGLLPWLSALENVRLGARLRGTRDRDSHRRAAALLERVGLHGWCNARPGSLSGGMRQRVALARTLFEERPVVLMDEPFSRLDALTRGELQQLAFGLLAACTVVMVTHDPLEAVQLASAVVLLHAGASVCSSRHALDGAPPRAMDTLSTVTQAQTLRDALGSTSRRLVDDERGDDDGDRHRGVA